VRSIRSLLAVLMVGVLSFSFTACGDDDGGTPLTAGNDDSSGDSSDDLDLPDSEELDDLADMAGVDEVCLGAAYLAAAAFGGAAGGEDAEELQAYFEEARDQVPDEIKDDFDKVAEAMQAYGALLEEYEGDFTKLATDPDAQDVLSQFDSDEFTEASDNVSAWFDENCDTTE
jgi:hypothetical protein